MTANSFEEIKQQNDIHYQMIMKYVEEFKNDYSLSIPQYVEGIRQWIGQKETEDVFNNRVIWGYAVLGKGVSLKDRFYRNIAEQPVELVCSEIDEIEENALQNRNEYICTAKKARNNQRKEEALIEASLHTIYLENLLELREKLQLNQAFISLFQPD